MRREQLSELHYITPIDNVGSILTSGILSHRRCRALAHKSVSMKEVQDIRARKAVPGGRPLHEYVNLYMCARNPMLFKRKDLHKQLCVLKIRTDVLDLPGVVITDQNAASNYARFARAPEGLGIVDHARVFAEYWKHYDDPIEDWRHTSVKCAEVLVPDEVSPSYIVGAYVSCSEGHASWAAVAGSLPADIDPWFFFLG